MKGGSKSSLRPFLHQALQLLRVWPVGKNQTKCFILVLLELTK